MDELTVDDARQLLFQESAPLDDSPAGDSKASDAPETSGTPDVPSVSDASETPDAPDARETPDVPATPEASATPDAPDERSYLDGSVGLGVDIVEIDRMAGILERQPSFAEKVFSPDERAYCDSTANPATHYALRFAAKEAVVKALGTGFSNGIWVRDIEVKRNKQGRPSAVLTGRALEVAQEQGVRELSLSLSYTRSDAVACALAVTESSLRASEKRKDPMEELARQFKETRKMLDDL